MSKLLLGTTNKSKLQWYKSVLSGYPIEVVDLSSFPGAPVIEEDLFDIEGNAVKKSNTLAKFSGLTTLSTDTGVFIDALNGEPGVAARRWMGELPDDVTDEEWISFFLQKIAGIPEEKLTCYKKTVTSISFPSGESESVSLVLTGRIRINPKPKYVEGSPFGAFFWLDEYGQFEEELDEKTREKYMRTYRENIEPLVKKLVS